MNARARFPLLAKMLVWLMLHLLVLGGVFGLFVAWQLRLGLNSLLNGATGDRLKTFGTELAADLATVPANSWPEVLKKQSEATGLTLSIRGENLPPPDDSKVPANIAAQLEEIRRNGPRGDAGGRGGRRPPPPELREEEGNDDVLPEGPPEDGDPDDPHPPRRHGGRPDRFAQQGEGTGNGGAGARDERTTVKPFFLMRGDHGQGYWAAMDLPVKPADRPLRHQLLLIGSDTASGHGLFFDLTPWIQGGVAVFVLSLLVWAPFFLGITRYLARLSRATDSIAGGKFDVSTGRARSDELGLLGNSIETMASRLDRLVTGQKRFLADVAHELCSPLARIRTGFGVLEHTIPETHRERVESIDEDVEELSRLVSEVLAFTKASTAPGAVRCETFELQPLVERALLRECPGQQAELKIPEHSNVHADRALLDRAIANVLRNAHRHAGSESELHITVKPVDKFLQLTIADTGPGVAEADLPRLFEPFFRPDAARTREAGGTGLGLAIVRSALEACGGSVHAEAVQPHGLAVVLLIPAG